MTIVDGEYPADDVEKIEELLLDRFEAQHGTINKDELGVLRQMYRPVAEQYVQLQNDVGNVLESAQIENADGQALDLLVALVGVFREEAVRATGEVRFYRNNPVPDGDNFTIPAGTIAQTESLNNPIQVQTTEPALLEEGETEVFVTVEAREAGVRSNLAPETVVSMVDSPSGIQEVINDEKISGGRPEESDAELRERAQNALSEGSRATADAITSAINRLPGTESAKVYPNYEHDFGDDPGFEVLVNGGEDEDIAQTILDNKAAGDHTYHGNISDNGVTVDVSISTGEQYIIGFSRPDILEIEAEITLETKNTFAGENEVRNAIVDYIGGVNTEGQNISGDLGIGDDVIEGEVEFAIRTIEGVYDVPHLDVDENNNNVTTTNHTINNNQLAVIQAENITFV